jgi:hypothetical protein
MIFVVFLYRLLTRFQFTPFDVKQTTPSGSEINLTELRRS